MKSRLSVVMMRSHSSYVCLVNLLGVNVVRWMVPGFRVVEKDKTPPGTIQRTTFTPNRLTRHM
jgi:hypothetical protein